MQQKNQKKSLIAKKVIFFAISDNYSFAAANVIMGLHKYSTELMQKCDIIIYHDGICDKNKQLLNKIHNNIIFKEMIFPQEWESMLQAKRTLKWGYYVIAKLLGFELIKQYEKVLFLDVDMLVNGDISALFQIEEEMAWRKVLAWNPKEDWVDIVKNPDDNISVPNGGLVYFTDKLLKYNIDIEYIADVFSKVQQVKRGGTEEIVLAYIGYDKQIRFKELSVSQYNTSVYEIFVNPESAKTKLIHFVDCKATQQKPWKSLAAYLCFPDWVENYQKWIEMGGDGPVCFGERDYYTLFSFDKANKIEALNREIKKLKEEKGIFSDRNQKLTSEIQKKKKVLQN